MRWRLVAVGVAAYTLGLLIMAPASLLDVALKQVSDGRLRLSDAQGSLWSGSGQIEVRNAGGAFSRKMGIAKTVSWRLLPGFWLGGLVNCEIRLDQLDKPIVVAMFWSRFEVSDADLNLPATALGLALPKVAPLGLGGEVAIHVAHLSIGNSAIKGHATVHWRAASSALTNVTPLGDYELNLDGNGAALRATLRTLKGPLQLDGQGGWAEGTTPMLQVRARIAPDQVQQLSPLLRLIAIERGEGEFELQLR